MKKKFVSIICFYLAITYMVDNSVYCEEKKTSEPIKIILNSWTSQIVLAKIAGNIFEKVGYSVEYKTLTMEQQWGLLARGKYHVQVEIWEGTMKDMFEHMVSLGKIIDAGSHTAKTREEWWYPSYVEELCPGLPDWRALKNCYKIFATPETAPKGKYIGGLWEKPDRARIWALGLNFKVVEIKKTEDLWDELEKAYKNKKPVLLHNWTPNWVESKYEGKFVEFPEFEPECETDLKWGINPNAYQDCGNPKDGWLKKGAWSGMPEKWPCAFEILKNISFDNTMLSKLSYGVDVDKKSHDEVSKKWILDNKKLWQSWIPKSCSNQ